jgi:uncharacterized protein (DUF2249 family)/hemerythrin-like domain-containing protein
MTSTDAEALQAMLDHHAALADGVARRVAALRSAAESHRGYEAPTAELVAYLAREVLPHALAEEQTLYQAAAAKADLAETVAGMVEEHHELSALAERLATAHDSASASESAGSLDALFAAHVKKENELILPRLATDPDVDLSGLLVKMHRRMQAAQEETTGVATGRDVEADLVRLLLRAADQLAEAKRGDNACMLAAQAWSVVRGPRPELAVRVTAALHRLVRSVTSEPVTLSARGKEEVVSGVAVLDVRSLAPAQRHEKIFATFGALSPGSAFVLVNDHDPKPLRYQFEAEHQGEFTWEVLEAGPTVWQVRIGRSVDQLGEDDASRRAETRQGDDPELDVRRFPHGQRHDVIFTTFDALVEGSGFVLVNDHDPKPLRYQFEAQHAGRYSWDYLEAGPTVWRVRIGRPSGVRP